MSLTFVGLWLVGGVAAVAAAWQAKFHRLAALMLSGTAGAVCCLTFIWFSAPDLALTQLMVETVTTVLILLGLRWLPPRRMPQGFDARAPGPVQLRRARDFLVAAAGGLGLAALAYAVLVRGGVFGLGDRLHVFPWAALKYERASSRFILDIDKSWLDALPGFDDEHWPAMTDSAWASAVECDPYKHGQL